MPYCEAVCFSWSRKQSIIKQKGNRQYPLRYTGFEARRARRALCSLSLIDAQSREDYLLTWTVFREGELQLVEQHAAFFFHFCSLQISSFPWPICDIQDSVWMSTARKNRQLKVPDSAGTMQSVQLFRSSCKRPKPHLEKLNTHPHNAGHLTSYFNPSILRIPALLKPF